MKRFISVLVILALMGFVAGVNAQSPSQNSGFLTGHVSSADDVWSGGLPAGGQIVKVTQVTSTTVFYIEAYKGVTTRVGTTATQIDSLLPGKFKLRGMSCFTTANEGFEVQITAYVMGSGKITTSAWGTALTLGDYLLLTPITSAGDPLATAVYIRVDTGSFAAAGTFEESGFNRILTITGLCRVRIVPEIVIGVAITGANQTMSLGGVTNTQSMIANTDEGYLDTGQIWLSNTQSLTDPKFSLGSVDQLVNGVNIGHTLSAGGTAGQIIYHCFVTFISPGATAVTGAGEAT